MTYDGAPSTSHDLGLELDFGAELRIPVEFGMTFQLGAQAGVLLPGHALDDARGRSLGAQSLAIGRFGLQY